MKSNLTLEIVEKNDHHDNSNNDAFKSSNNQLSFIASGLKEESEDYPKNIENYYLLLKALYENSSMLSRIKDDPIHEQSCEKKFESFKENIIANQIHNNEIPNQQLLQQQQQQQQQQIYRKNININIKNDSDRNSMKDIIINSLDVSINVASKPTTTNNYGNVKILCTTTTKPSTQITFPPTTPSPSSLSFNSKLPPSILSDNQDINLVTSSCSAEDDEEINKIGTAVTSPVSIASISNEKTNNNLTSNNANSSNSNPTRAVNNNHGVETFRSHTIPDDMSFDYHNIKNYYNDKTTTSRSLSNLKNYQAQSPTPLRTICDDDYHHSKEMPSIDITKHNKYHNNSTNIKPITSTYLRLTRSWGIWDEDALNLVS